MVPRKAKGKRPIFCDDVQVDKLLSIVMNLAGEVQVLRERLDTTERIASRKGLYSSADIESYRATVEEEAEREQARDEFLSRVLWIVEQEIEGLRTKETEDGTKQDVHWVATS